ncbi:hypothetical protein Tco_1414979 [Tanacetum coccineum]
MKVLYSSTTSSSSGCWDLIEVWDFYLLSDVDRFFHLSKSKGLRDLRAIGVPLACAAKYGQKKLFRGAYSVCKWTVNLSLTGRKRVAGRCTTSDLVEVVLGVDTLTMVRGGVTSVPEEPDTPDGG